jgi:hypothetical protein
MKRWCEIYAGPTGSLLVVFREMLGNDPVGVVYGHFASQVPVPSVVETSYADRGPFNIGSITRMRVVS